MLRKTSVRLTLAFLAIACLMLTAAGVTAKDERPGELEFKANNAIYNAHGSFKRWHFTEVNIPDGDLTRGTVAFEVDLTSVWEKAQALADHLRAPDFFNVKKYPTATVKIHNAKAAGAADTYSAEAKIDFLGVSRTVPVNFKVTGTDPLRIEGTATMDRTAFNLGGPSHDANNERSIVNSVSIMLNTTVAMP
ncbi:MAG: YceI family protein [Acidobacteriota bacterium]